MTRIADLPNVLLDVPTGVPNETNVLPPARQQFPKVSLLLPATTQNHAPTMATPMTASGGQRPVTVADVDKGPPGRIGARPTSVSACVAFRDDGTRKMLGSMVASPPPPWFYSSQELDPNSFATARPPPQKKPKTGTSTQTRGGKAQKKWPGLCWQQGEQGGEGRWK